MAKRDCRGSVRPAPAARGVGRVGCGTEGYFVDFLRLAQSGGLRPLCGDDFVETIRLVRGYVSLGSDGEANACNLAFCFAVTRLLAAAPVSVAAEDWDRGICQSAGTACSREAAAILSRRGFDGHDFYRAVARRSSPHICECARFAASG